MLFSVSHKEHIPACGNYASLQGYKKRWCTHSWSGAFFHFLTPGLDTSIYEIKLCKITRVYFSKAQIMMFGFNKGLTKEQSFLHHQQRKVGFCLLDN